MALPLLLSLAIARIPEGEKATAMGYFQAVYAAGMFVGPATAGLVGGWAILASSSPLALSHSSPPALPSGYRAPPPRDLQCDALAHLKPFVSQHEPC
jgi:MFS family permease